MRTLLPFGCGAVPARAGSEPASLMAWQRLLWWVVIAADAVAIAAALLAALALTSGVSRVASITMLAVAAFFIDGGAIADQIQSGIANFNDRAERRTGKRAGKGAGATSAAYCGSEHCAAS